MNDKCWEIVDLKYLRAAQEYSFISEILNGIYNIFRKIAELFGVFSKNSAKILE